MKTKILIAIIGLLVILSIIGIIFSQSDKKETKSNKNNITNKIKTEKKLVTFIYNIDTCKECSELIEPLKKYSAKYNFEYVVYDITKSDEDKYNEALKKLLTEDTKIQNSYFIYTKNGNVIGMSNGIVDKSGLKKFLDYVKISKD